MEITYPLPKPLSATAPRKSFDNVEAESKRQKINDHLQVNTPSKITASAIKIFEHQHPKYENLLESMDQNNLTQNEIMDIACKYENLKPKCPLESLQFMTINDLSKRQYIAITSELKS